MTVLNQAKTPRLVVVTIEGLGTNLVGCYGGAIAPTKNWDHFASQSIVFDQFWADALQPVDVLHSFWSGSHFAFRELGASRELGAIQSEHLNHSRVSFLKNVLFATDTLSVLEESETEEFGDILYFESEAIDDQESQEDSDEVLATQLEQLFQAALGKWSTQLNKHPVLWIHSSGLNGPWDAPYAYRQVMCDEGDPDPPTGIEPADLQLTDDTDPDEVFGHSCCAGGQAIAMDEAWELLEDAIGELGIADDCMLILVGVSGYPMGEHGWVGNGLNSLYAETIHLPMIIRPGNRLEVGQRVPFIIQPHQLLGTMKQWLDPHFVSPDVNLAEIMDLPPAESWPIAHQFGFSLHEGQMHLIVPAWSYRQSINTEGVEAKQLYTMPDDRWQQNEVSQRAGSIVELMENLRGRCVSHFQSDSVLLEATRLPEELTHPLR